jgi:hypothetical protein
MTNEAAETRREILAQHQGLRTQLIAIRHAARDATHARPGEAPDLPRMLDQVLAVLTAHMAFENEHLAPLLHGRNPSGRRYAALLVEEHVRQREELLAIARQAADPDDIVALGLAVAAFASDVLQDMDDEELQFLTPHSLADEGDEQAPERQAGR